LNDCLRICDARVDDSMSLSNPTNALKPTYFQYGFVADPHLAALVVQRSVGKWLRLARDTIALHRLDCH
jgi:hypothetical protein